MRLIIPYHISLILLQLCQSNYYNHLHTIALNKILTPLWHKCRCHNYTKFDCFCKVVTEECADGRHVLLQSKSDLTHSPQCLGSMPGMLGSDGANVRPTLRQIPEEIASIVNFSAIAGQSAADLDRLCNTVRTVLNEGRASNDQLERTWDRADVQTKWAVKIEDKSSDIGTFQT